MTKTLIFDSGTLINLSMNGLLYLLPKLKQKCDCTFLITKEVKKEVVDRPSNVPRFKLGALRVQSLLDSKVLQLPSDLKIPDSAISKKTKYLMELANHSLQSDGKWIKIISQAETSCLALSSELSKLKIQNIISADERTIRILSEKPDNLKKIMERKLHRSLKLERENFEKFENFKFIRSSELVYVAYKKGLLRVKGQSALEAVLFATKYKGAAISHDEIKELKRL
ncbi:hypothetical protein CMI47_03400 [Candidatus Pacearchaeota archaeon]|nr:hypothetical protein [Candidatus Pacearchaeota archaeon]|tara:strand:+ start:4535 stop:5212 length:678 start_codon:yes stop_codon:yes gene_type:complete